MAQHLHHSVVSTNAPDLEDQTPARGTCTLLCTDYCFQFTKNGFNLINYEKGLFCNQSKHMGVECNYWKICLPCIIGWRVKMSPALRDNTSWEVGICKNNPGVGPFGSSQVHVSNPINLPLHKHKPTAFLMALPVVGCDWSSSIFMPPICGCK